MSCNFRSIVARNCVGDRSLADDANLFDIEQKYANGMELEAIIASLRALAST